MTPYTLADAEADLRAAIDVGDRPAIDAACDALERLEPAPRPTPSLHSSALYYASLGIPTFPLSPGTKIPFKGSSGLKDATTDAEQINAWWTERAEANIGIATGHLFDVVDIDGFLGQASRAARWDDVFAHIEADQFAKVLTPSPGGMHLYTPPTGDPNGTNILPGVDFRGLGGYVVAPPSVGPAGRYRFLGLPDFSRLAKAVAA